jgi:2-dehydro-3-deoxygluconokinase
VREANGRSQGTEDGRTAVSGADPGAPWMEWGRPVDPRPVLSLGEALIALAPEIPGPLERANTLLPYVVGAELNTAVALARLGVRVEYAGAVGTDPWGRRVIRALKAEGVGTRWLQSVPDCPTAVMFKEWSGLDASTTVYYYRALSPMAQGRFLPGALETAMAAGAVSWLHISGITWGVGAAMAEAAEAIMAAAARHGIPVSFDLNVRRKMASREQWVTIVERALPFCTWVLGSDDEMTWLFGAAAEEERDWLAWCRARGFTGPGLVVKRGAKGASVATADGVVTSPAWPVAQPVDTVGAGDGFDAGFIAGHRWGWAMAETLRLANLLGASALTSRGDNDGYPDAVQVRAWLEGSGLVTR